MIGWIDISCQISTVLLGCFLVEVSGTWFLFFLFRRRRWVYSGREEEVVGDFSERMKRKVNNKKHKANDRSQRGLPKGGLFALANVGLEQQQRLDQALTMTGLEEE